MNFAVNTRNTCGSRGDPRRKSASRVADPVASIAFDRTKYGPPLQVDAGLIRSLPNFITSPQPHRLGFYEIALFTRGRGVLELDGVGTEVAPFRLCCTRPGEIRRWRVDDTLDGRLVFFEREFVEDFLPDTRFLARSPLFADDSRVRAGELQRTAFERMSAIADDMLDELADVRDDSGHMLRAHMYRLLVELQRQAPQTGDQQSDDRNAIHRRFAALLDEHYRRHQQVAAYAALLGVSASHLNQCVRRASGRTASETIHRRLYAEARRLLLYTGETVAAIATDLSFSDAPYFNRFFKRMAGVTPGEFRATPNVQ